MAADGEPVSQPLVYLVLAWPGGLQGTYPDLDRARAWAQAIDGVVVECPIVEDYRREAP